MASSFRLSQTASFVAPTLHYRTRKLTKINIRYLLNVRSAMQDRQNIGNQISAQEFFESFLKERQSKSDFVSRASDVLWRRELYDADEEKLEEVRKRIADLQKMKEEEGSGGFLKLSQTKQWGLGVEEAPSNVRLSDKGLQTWKADRKRLGLLEYEALKRELSLITTGVAAVCTIYCSVVITFQAALSYGIGALGSLLYLRLLSYYVDKLSEEDVPEIFMIRREKKIGIRSEDLQDSFAKVFYGSGFAIASPRLLIPASLYGLSVLLYQLSDKQLNLEIAPMMFGFFAYKAALLIQAYRDNQDLAMVFGKNDKV